MSSGASKIGRRKAGPKSPSEDPKLVGGEQKVPSGEKSVRPKKAAVDRKPKTSAKAGANGSAKASPNGKAAGPEKKLKKKAPAAETGKTSDSPKKKSKAEKNTEKNAEKNPEKEPQQDSAEAVAGRRSALSGWKAKLLSSWGLSLIIHNIVIVALALTMLPAIIKPEPPSIVALPRTDDDELTQELDQDVTPATEMSVSSSSQSTLQTGHASTLQGATAPSFDKAVSETGPQVRVDGLSLTSISGSQLAMDVGDEAPGDPQAVVDGYDEAMDRITQEIMMMLAKGKVMVIWAFDQSESMKDDQEEIRQKIYLVYQELGLQSAAQGDALVTGVVSYGDSFKIHTENPTSDVERIKQAISEVPIDTTGKERMCEAVLASIQRYKKVAISGRRQLALILVTDESGDQDTNVSLLEPAINEARAARCRCYVLGREAVFGYPYAHMRWRHPQTGHIHWLPVDRGPETAFVEQLQTSGFHRRYDAHASGFGPFEQARMARETGGIFFMLPSVESDLVRGDNRKYELQAMRPYMPSLETRQEYALERDNSVLRSTLWTVISELNPYRPDRKDIIEMRMEFSANPQRFADQVAKEKIKAAQYVTFLHAAEQQLEKIRHEREQEIYPRWQANYDLLFAQVLAYKVRLYEYGAYLEEFIKNPKIVPLTKPPNARLAEWNIRHRKETITGDLTKDHIERATKMFQDVIKDHPGTPWAARAEWELARNFGIELQEEYHSPSPPGPRKPRPVTIPVPKF